MKRILIVAVASLLAAGRASAADLPVRTGPAPAYYPVATIYDWGGGYIGINGGYAFGQSNWVAANLHHKVRPTRRSPGRASNCLFPRVHQSRHLVVRSVSGDCQSNGIGSMREHSMSALGQKRHRIGVRPWGRTG
jgi:opacity protein-like surface antigen